MKALCLGRLSFTQINIIFSMTYSAVYQALRSRTLALEFLEKLQVIQ